MVQMEVNALSRVANSAVEKCGGVFAHYQETNHNHTTAMGRDTLKLALSLTPCRILTNSSCRALECLLIESSYTF